MSQIWNWRQWSGITVNSTTTNDERNLISVSFIINWRTLGSCSNLRENKSKILLAKTTGRYKTECQKRSGPPKKYRHSFIEWQASYPFDHIGIDFMGPLPMSNGNKHILVIGDHFTKWYWAIPLLDQTAVSTANVLVDHWINRFGCPHSLHSDQGRNFESKLLEQLLHFLKVDKTRTTPFHPQSNAVIERLKKTLQNMLAKCIKEKQSNWLQQLPYVMMAYWSSVH